MVRTNLFLSAHGWARARVAVNKTQTPQAPQHLLVSVLWQLAFCRHDDEEHATATNDRAQMAL